MSQSTAQISPMASVISPAETDAFKESTIKKSYQVFHNIVTENVLKDSSDERQMKKRRRLFIKNNFYNIPYTTSSPE